MRIFVDTSAWYALADSRDQYHKLALEILEKNRDRCLLVTSDYVIDETVTIIRNRLSHLNAVKFLDLVSSSKSILNVPISKKILEEGEKIFRRYSDKSWSFTDCVSFALMDSLDLSYAFTFDHNFTEYGKTLLGK